MVLKVWGVGEKGGDEGVFYQPLEVQKKQNKKYGIGSI
jgi:hypothetical protein